MAMYPQLVRGGIVYAYLNVYLPICQLLLMEAQLFHQLNPKRHILFAELIELNLNCCSE